MMGGWCPGVWVGSKNKYEAGKFVELLGGKEADWLFCTEGLQVANRKSTYVDHAEFFARPENQFIVTYKYIMDNEVYPMSPFGFVGIKQFMYEAMHDYYLDDIDPMTALQNAEKKFNEANGKG